MMRAAHTSGDLERLAAALGCVLPADALSLDPALRRDHRVAGVEPLLVARPGDVAGVAAVLRTVNELGAAVVPWGGGTQQAMKLHVGALGTLGVIVDVNLKVLPRPATIGGLAAGFPDLAGALAVADRLAASQLLPSAVNLLGQLPAGPGAGGSDPRDVGLSVIVEGAERAVGGQHDQFAGWCHEQGGRANVLPAAAAEAALRQAADFPQTAFLAPDEAVVKLEIWPGRLGDALDHVATVAASHGLPGSWLAHAPQAALFLRLTGADRDGGAARRR